MAEDIIEFLVKNNFSLEGIENVSTPVLTFKADEYDLCIDANVANCLMQYQETVYRTYCLGKYGSNNIRRLTPEEKEQLSLKFKIKEGSTEYIAEAKGFMSMILESLPEEHRIWAVLIVSCTFSAGLGSYLYYKYKASRLNQETFIKEQDNNRLAIKKLAEIAQGNQMAAKATEIAMENEKEIINSLEKTESSFTVSGKKYLKTEIKNLSREYSQKEETIPKAYLVKGIFRVTAITVENPYKITVENSTEGTFTANYDPKFFSQSVLNAARQGLENRKPIYFDITLNVLEENNTKNILLVSMFEHKHND